MRRISILFLSLAFAFTAHAQNIQKKTHDSYSWKVHEIAKDFELLDVWEFPISADKTRNQDFSLFLKIMQQSPKKSISSFFSIRHLTARFLVSLRVYLGEIFDLDKNLNTLPIPGCKESSLKERLSDEDLKKSLPDSVGEGAQTEGIWRTVYIYENEMLTEHSNDTVHALMHFGWVRKSGNNFTAQLAVYAKPRGNLGVFYMKLIMPFRHVIVYPVMMEEVKKRWDSYNKISRQQSIEAWEKRTFIKQPPEKVMDIAGIKPGMVIGEVGAGRGRFTMHLARRVGPKGQILANDIDADALAYLRERCKRANVTNVKTILGEQIDPLFPKDSLDMIFMVWVYHYVEQPLPLLKNLSQSLKPGGTVVLVEPRPGLVYEGQDHGISPERMRRDAEQAGFKLVRAENYLQEDFIFILHLDDQPVTFTQSPQIFPPARTNHVGLGDFDGDGDLDAVLSNQFEHHSQILINNGKGYFTDSGQKLTPQGHGAGIGDLDNDGDLDLFIACAGWTDKDCISHNRPSKVYINDGRGHFKDSGLDLGDTDPSGNGINLIDIDADGDLDAHIYYYTVTENPFYHIIYINDGNGRFKSSDIILPKGSFPFWGDLNKDGFVDVFLMEWRKGLRALKNDGKGRFSECWQLPDTNILYGDAAIGDLDKDGDLDVIVSNREGSSEKPTYVFFNDGTGRFRNSAQNLNPTKNPHFCLADLNGDGFLDVYVSNFRAPNEVWLNNQKGEFIDAGLRMCGDDPTSKISIGDLDGDGDPDVFVSFYGDGSNSIWFNRSRGDR